eukprot:TRINITY_DN7782_c0_g1_i4.p1 TRINITY_DN7782_c0_g1~~TRINITY_DN7782_c0_g1_i4.p1  ORF type:complete len:290 (-),score=50.15 TRINITY_DN7782_c0_g1_i4:72-941(-)
MDASTEASTKDVFKAELDATFPAATWTASIAVSRRTASYVLSGSGVGPVTHFGLASAAASFSTELESSLATAGITGTVSGYSSTTDETSDSGTSTGSESLLLIIGGCVVAVVAVSVLGIFWYRHKNRKRYPVVPNMFVPDPELEKMTESALNRARKKFDSLDEDKNGYLEGKELYRLSEWLWEGFHPGGEELDEQAKHTQAKRLLDRLDRNKDGKMDFKEFSVWFKRTCVAIERHRRQMVGKGFQAAGMMPAWYSPHSVSVRRLRSCKRAFSILDVLSLIHISEPTRPY